MKSIFVFCLVLALAACGKNEIQESGDIAGGRIFQIRNGTPTTDPVFEGVVLLEMGSALCTGTLISPTEVLTAAHCVFNRSASSVKVFEDVAARAAQTFISSREIRIHPSYDGTIGSYDLAVIRLSKRSKLDPLSLSSSLPTKGQSVGIVGFGVTANASDSRLKRLGTSVILGSALGSSGSPYLAMAPGSSNQIICPGDSGGPMLHQGQILGVASFGRIQGQFTNSAEACEKGVLSFHNMVHPFIHWILGDSASHQNPLNRFDTDENGRIDIEDVLMVQNAIEATGERRLKARDAVGKIDVNGDGRLSTVDLELLSTFVQFLLN